MCSVSLQCSVDMSVRQCPDLTELRLGGDSERPGTLLYSEVGDGAEVGTDPWRRDSIYLKEQRQDFTEEVKSQEA